ncbi:Xaa-Pro peptidase family protein [Bradyrhizobium sp. 170]|uniref:M24 family metallopeptidase n=1 Tax=Bradyrhizobium sp. 170 TaxID=2782641 RepID=UPI001FFF07A8|nr:Xaa-Pro peptidase family protein [Bradyrhizobium sp. 170]UPK05778.1 M24 family metallopeptidase [Bradyrhizobium sp. 170]
MAIMKGPQAFPRAEYLRRLATVKSEMARREVDAFVVTSWANITYLTGNVTRMHSLHGLVVSLHEEEPTLVVRGMDAPGCIHQTFLDRGKVIGYPESLIGKPDKNGFDAVIDAIYDLGVASRGLGLELGNLPAPAAEKFRRRLPEAKIIDCTKTIDWIRGIKSDLEIAVMREAASIADAAIARAAEVIRPGVREADAVAEITAAQIRGPNGGPAGTNLKPFLMCSSPRTGTPHILWSEDVFREGSQINIELSGHRHNYVAPIMRTFSIGVPSDRLHRLHEAEVSAMDAALNAVRPGRTCSDVANAFYRTLEKHGFKKESRCGYAIGIDWMEPTASLADGDMTELKPNMTFHLMLGNWLDEDFGYVISESICVTDTGVEVLTQAPRKLFQL